MAYDATTPLDHTAISDVPGEIRKKGESILALKNLAGGIAGISSAGKIDSAFIPRFIGELIPFAGASAPTHSLLANGAAISRTTYSELFSVIGTTYGAGDGSTTFNLPNFANGQFIRGTGGNAAALGTAQAEGLPDIYGKFQVLDGNGNVLGEAGCAGAFSGGNLGGVGIISFSGTVNRYRDCNFYASAYNTIYGAKTHVTPINNAATFCIVYE